MKFKFKRIKSRLSNGIHGKVVHEQNRSFACSVLGSLLYNHYFIVIHKLCVSIISCLMSGILSLSIRVIIKRQKGLTLKRLNSFQICSCKSIVRKRSYSEVQTIIQRSCCGRSKSENLGSLPALPSPRGSWRAPRTFTDPRSMAWEGVPVSRMIKCTILVTSVSW